MSIKLCAIDLDGPIYSSKESHFLALNLALSDVDPKYAISESQHVSFYDGLTTIQKLNKLVETKGFPKKLVQSTFDSKQKYTLKLIAETTKPDVKLQELFKQIKKEGYKLAVVTNSIRQTSEDILTRLGLIEYLDTLVTNQNVKNPKPNSEGYLKAMIDCGVSPLETLIIEDSVHGVKSALNSGAKVMVVRNRGDMTYSNLKLYLDPLPARQTPILNLNVLVLMSGKGSRFIDGGYLLPKPLIDVSGVPMIQKVIESVCIQAHYIYVVNAEQRKKYNLDILLNNITPNCTIVETHVVTEGAACSALLCKDLINSDKALLTVNADQLVEWNPMEFIYPMYSKKADGSVLTFHVENDVKWSYVKVNDEGYVTEVAEKIPISTHGTVGLYLFNKGSEFVKYAEQMIRLGKKVRGEYYTAMVYEEYINDGKKILIHPIQTMHSLGVPADLEAYLKK